MFSYSLENVRRKLMDSQQSLRRKCKELSVPQFERPNCFSDDAQSAKTEIN